MANLTGKIIDVTNQPPGSVVDIHVKAPRARVGSGTGAVVSSPAVVNYNESTGELTLTNLTGGLSWLVIEGVGWSDTVALAVAEGMTTLVEAIANAAGVPGVADYVSLIRDGELQLQQLADTALADAKSYVDSLVKGSVPALGTTDLDTLTGTRNYRQTSSLNVSPDLHYPPITGAYKAGTLIVMSSGGGSATQLYIADRAGEVYVRECYVGTWREWQKIGRPSATVGSLGTTDLDTLTDSETYRQTASSNITEALHYPPVSGQYKAGTLIVTSSGGGDATQVYIADQAGEMWTRARVAGAWRGWVQIGAGGGDSPTPTPTTPSDGIPTLEMEVTGKWTPTEKGDAFLLALAEKHDQVQALEIGRSVQNRPIYAAIIGDPTLPAILITAGVHGTEVGPPESAWLWVKEMAQSKSLILMDMCIIVVPCVQPDNRFIARGNKNAVDINRDWVDLSQPETQAVNSLFLTYNVVAMMDSHNFGYPREVSLLPANLGKPEVNALSQELYDVVFSAFEAEGELVRDYGPGLDERSLVQGAAILHDVAALLIEIPCGGYGEWTFDDYYPPPSWQAHVGSIAYTTFANHVWRNLPAFLALKTAD